MGTTKTSDSDVSTFEISLRITHPHADPRAITEKLVWEPTLTRKSGERTLTPKGNLTPKINSNSFWMAKVDTTNHMSIASAIKSCNKRLLPRKSYLAELRSEGGTAEYFIGWFVGFNAGEMFDPVLLRECAELNITLTFDVYGSRTSVRDSDE